MCILALYDPDDLQAGSTIRRWTPISINFAEVLHSGWALKVSQAHPMDTRGCISATGASSDPRSTSQINNRSLRRSAPWPPTLILNGMFGYRRVPVLPVRDWPMNWVKPQKVPLFLYAGDGVPPKINET